MPITILADAAAEAAETVTLTLSDPVNGIITTTTATLTIGDTAPTPPDVLVVRPGALQGWLVEFLQNTAMPGFVTAAGAPLGAGGFRFDTGAPGAAAAGAKVEFSHGGLNDQLVSDLTGLSFHVFLEENDASAGTQPYVVLKVDADANGSIDTTLNYVHTPLPLNVWTAVNTQDARRPARPAGSA